MTIRDDDPNKPKPEESEVELRLPDDDPDVIAQKQALEALAAAEAQAGDQGEKKDPPADPKAQAEGEAKDPPAGDDEPITIPKARLDKVLKDLEEERLEKARLEGALAATAALAKPAEKAEEEKPQLTHEQVDAHFDKAIDELDQQLDDAKLTMSEWRQKTRNVEKLRRETHDQLEAQSEPEDDTPRDSLAAAEATEKLVEGRPWVEKVTAEEWEDLRPLAVRQLKREGVELGEDEQSTILLRAAMIKTAEGLGYPALYGAGTGTKPTEAKPEGKPAGDKSQKLNPQQVKEKVDLATRQPALPETPPGANNEEVDPASVLSEEDALRLPPSARDRLMESILGPSR